MERYQPIVWGFLAALVVAGCSATGGAGGGNGGSANATGGVQAGGGGTAGAGGSSTVASSGGASGSGGTSETGGSLGSGGGMTETGGSPGSGGGSSGTGGASPDASPGDGGRPRRDDGGRDTVASGGVSGDGGHPSSGGSAATGGSTGGGGSTTPAGTSAGCGQAKPSTAPKSVDVAGTERTFVLDVPGSYDPGTPMPVLFVFHGMGLDGAFFRTWSKLTTTFGATYLVIYLDALGDPTSWDSSGTKDLEFFEAALELVGSAYCIDTKRVFATGHSSGGYFTNAVGCAHGDKLRGIAPQAGGGPFNTRSCKGPLAALIIHGDSDPSVKPAEGVKSRDYWAKAAGCGTDPVATSALDPVCVDSSGCPVAYPVVYCPYAGDHNLWSEAPRVIFDFFKAL